MAIAIIILCLGILLQASLLFAAGTHFRPALIGAPILLLLWAISTLLLFFAQLWIDSCSDPLIYSGATLADDPICQKAWIQHISPWLWEHSWTIMEGIVIVTYGCCFLAIDRLLKRWRRQMGGGPIRMVAALALSTLLFAGNVIEFMRAAAEFEDNPGIKNSNMP